LFIESILSTYLQDTGQFKKIGCLTSPHLSDIRERIRLDSALIPKDRFAKHFSGLFRKILDSLRQDVCPETHRPLIPGYPGFLALLGWYTLVKERVEIAIIETGVGGETDSTNIADHATVTGITTLGLEHANVLGGSLREVAWHKAGIFKADAPAFTVEQESTALEVLQQRSRDKCVAGDLTVVPEDLVDRYGVTLTPNYQRSNASLAIALSEVCLQNVVDPHFRMTADIARILTHTQLPGRNETYAEGKRTWLLNAAHNEMSMKGASMWFKERLQELK
jgi:folylpolyglutamate synthase